MSELLERNNETSDLNAGLPISSDSDVAVEKKSLEDLNLRYGFKSGGYSLLIPEATESEVITSADIFSIPNTSALMLGLISVRGRFAPVFDLRKMLNIDINNRQKSIIVLTINGDYLAFPLDSAHSLELPDSATENYPELPDSLSEFASTVFQIGEDYWIEFDFKHCLKQFASKISQ